VKISGGDVSNALRGPLGWIVVAGVAVLVVYYVGGKLWAGIKAPFVAAGALVKDGVNAQTQALTQSDQATGNPVLDSISVGAAGGG